jgi:hypothetical protein
MLIWLVKVSAAAFVIVSLTGVIFYSAMIGAGLQLTAVGSWLAKETDNLATMIGTALVLVGLLVAPRQLRIDTEARREEARSRRYQEFADRIEKFRTPKARAAIMMLLNYERDVVIRDEHGPERVTWDECEVALIPARFREYLYEPRLIAIRDCFNELIENLTRLAFLLDEKLVFPPDVHHIAKPLVARIAADEQFSALHWPETYVSTSSGGTLNHF